MGKIFVLLAVSLSFVSVVQASNCTTGSSVVLTCTPNIQPGDIGVDTPGDAEGTIVEICENSGNYELMLTQQNQSEPVSTPVTQIMMPGATTYSSNTESDGIQILLTRVIIPDETRNGTFQLSVLEDSQRHVFISMTMSCH